MLFRDEVIIVIYFFYGLAFYSLGLALLVESGRSSELQIARSFRLLAAFGLLHGAHEWFDMFRRGAYFYSIWQWPAWIDWLQVVLIVASFLALFSFGERLLRQQAPPRYWVLTFGAICWYSLSTMLIRAIYDLQDRDWAIASDVLARYVMGIPGALLTAVALWRQRRIFNERGLDAFVPDLTMASIAIGIYGLPGQLFTRESIVFPSESINDVFFLENFGFPVQFMRAGLAALVAVAMIRVLRALDFENQQRVLAIQQEKLRAEQRNRIELNHLNLELQQANQETRRLLAEVQQRDARRGELLQRSTKAQEAERQRIARELHDETGQALTGLAMGLRGISMTLPAQNGCEHIAKQLTMLEAIATSAVGQLRNLINDLRPPQLDDMGLVAALRWLIKTLQERSSLAIEFEVRGETIPLPSEVETALFRMAQESLTNVLKHAAATHVNVSLDFHDGLTLIVQDDGTGFDPVEALNPSAVRKSWGLLGIQERANLIRASFDLQSAAGRGTRLTIRLNNLEVE